MKNNENFQRFLKFWLGYCVIAPIIVIWNSWLGPMLVGGLSNSGWEITFFQFTLFSMVALLGLFIADAKGTNTAFKIVGIPAVAFIGTVALAYRMGFGQVLGLVALSSAWCVEVVRRESVRQGSQKGAAVLLFSIAFLGVLAVASLLQLHGYLLLFIFALLWISLTIAPRVMMSEVRGRE